MTKSPMTNPERRQRSGFIIRASEFNILSSFVIRHSTFSDAAPFFMFDHVQAALLLQAPGPAARPVVLAVAHRPRTRPAPDAGIAVVVQGIIGNLVLDDEFPHITLGP